MAILITALFGTMILTLNWPNCNLDLGGKHMGLPILSKFSRNGVLCTFTDLKETYNLPSSIHFLYLQLSHAVVAQGWSSEWHLSLTPVFSLIRDAASSKGFISKCYAILLQSVLKHPLKVREKWEADIGQLDGEQWEEIFQAMGTCSLNVSQRLTQLYILLQIYYTPP